MNWQNILSDLSSWGFTQVQIAKKCGCTQSRISDLARNPDTTVSYSLGASLTAMHKAASRMKRKTEKVG
jgi:predicted XRE-type DNA-binding protein